MIKKIVLPEKIGSYYLFPKRIVGFDVGKTHVTATQLYISGKKIIIEKCIDEKLEPGTATNHSERATRAITHILQQVTYDSISITLSSSVAVFKELKLPFMSHNKIKMVIEFEVEPLLPFPASDAVIDFIITKQHPEEQSSEVLVAAVQKNHIAQLLQQFHDAGVDPEVITIDLFALYGMYEKLPIYTQMSGGTVLLDLGTNATRIAYILNGQLRLIRSLPKGIFSQAKIISEALQTSPNEVLTKLMRFGLENDDQTTNKAITKAFSSFWSDLSFTLSSFTAQAEHGINAILLVGGGADIKGLSAFITNISGIQCETFKIHELLHTPNVSMAQSNGLSNACIISLGSAFPSPITADFNLRQKEFSYAAATSIVTKQLIVAGALSLLLFGSLAVHSFFQLRKLKKEATAAEQEIIGMLRERFKKIPDDEQDISEVVKIASNEIKKEEQLWFSLASPSRVSFLTYLLELTTRIDKESLGFTLDKLKISENTIKLEDAHVKSYDALILLEKGLRQSKLFASISKVDEPNKFTMDIRLAKTK